MTLNAFLYGLICFTIGLVVLLRGRGDSELALGRQLHWLGGHALLLSAYSWGITLVHDRIGTEPLEVDTALVLLSLVASGVVLLRFGSGLIAEAGPLPLWMNFLPVALLIPSTMLIAYAIVVVVTATEVQVAIIQWSHDLLLLPGGILAAMGFARQWRRLKLLNDVPASIILLATAAAFLVNAIVGAVIPVSLPTAGAAGAPLIGAPTETWRLLLIALVAVLVGASMNVFEIERQHKIKRLEEARREAQSIALSIRTRTRQQAEVWLHALARISHCIAAMDEADDILKVVVGEARQMLGADAAVIALYEGEGRLCYKVRCVSGDARLTDSEPVENAVIVRAVAAGNPLRYPEDIGGAFAWRTEKGVFRAETAALVPLKLNTTQIGALWLGRESGKSFTCTDLIGLGYIANHAIIALEHASMAAELQSLAVIEERSRIAREMHDSLAQILGYLGLEMQTLEALVRQDDKDTVLSELHTARDTIKSAQADVRENILSLRTALSGKARPIDALKEYVEEFGIQTGVTAELVDRVTGDCPLTPLAEMQCVRIVQEALANVRKHAHAERVKVVFTTLPDRLEISIADDGVGMAPETISRGHFGLQTMRERAESVGGQLEITSTTGQGTRIVISLPTEYSELKGRTDVTPASTGR
ncbi:MAG: GAF domain-containing sensor histidine kinase [Chloroflexi bacterium]|nr:GAF domain-containing sensor histidine kinase [Chloroflexota bacterium]